MVALEILFIVVIIIIIDDVVVVVVISGFVRGVRTQPHQSWTKTFKGKTREKKEKGHSFPLLRAVH